MVAIAEARPPYVMFEVRAIEDRQASIEAGCFVAKDEIYAIITPQGSKDRIERVAADWFAQLEQQVTEGRFERSWLKELRAAYDDWKAGREPVVNGTDVRNWPAVGPAQVKLLLDARVRSVEDLALANEETLGRLGMGGRALKAKAVEWLASAKDVGKQAEVLAALKVENNELKVRNEELSASLASLSSRLAALEGGAKSTSKS